MNNTNTTNADEITLKNSINLLIEKTYKLFNKFVAPCTYEDFCNTFHPDTLGAYPPEITNNEKAVNNEKLKLFNITDLIMRLVWCAHNCHAEGKNYTEAWTYVAKAEFWSGSMFTLCNTTVDFDAVIKIARSEVAKSGGKTKDENYFAPLRKKTAELFTAPKEEPWDSLIAAAIKILELLRAELPDNANKLVGGSPERTISDWIKKIPDHKKYIKSKATNLIDEE